MVSSSFSSLRKSMTVNFCSYCTKTPCSGLVLRSASLKWQEHEQCVRKAFLGMSNDKRSTNCHSVRVVKVIDKLMSAYWTELIFRWKNPPPLHMKCRFLNLNPTCSSKDQRHMVRWGNVFLWDLSLKSTELGNSCWKVMLSLWLTWYFLKLHYKPVLLLVKQKWWFFSNCTHT